jgi:hypothetical protein
MAGRKGQNKKVLRSFTRVPRQYHILSESQWTLLEQKLRVKQLGGSKRLLIEQLNLIFAEISARQQTFTVGQVTKKILTWRHRTLALRHQIRFRPPSIKAKKDLVRSRDWLLKAYFNAPVVKKIPPLHDLQLLAHALDAAIATSDLVIDELSAADFQGVRGEDMWLVWVAAIESVLRKIGILTTASSDTGKLHRDSPFVAFIAAMQAYLPKQCQRFGKSSSIAKAIQRARREVGHRDPRALLLFMVEHWAFGGIVFTATRRNISLRSLLDQAEEYMCRERQQKKLLRKTGI